MITPKEIVEKADKQFVKVVRASFKREEMFPLFIPANKSLSGTNHSDLKNVLLPLYQQSKQEKGKGYSIDWKEKSIDGTKQKLPSKIYFETLEDFLYSTHRKNDFEMIIKSYSALTNEFPQLKEWAEENILFLLDQAGQLDSLIKVCRYFQANKPPHNLYLRELPVEVHSKFIEENSSALRKMLDILLDPAWINKEITDFSERYGVKKPNIFAQVRVLDDVLKQNIGFNEIYLTLDDFAALTWKPRKVFIIENKACFLSFPKVSYAIAIFGEGFKSRVNKDIPWLHSTDLYCWFDLDPAGFEMLNMIRKYYPEAKSFLMDRNTFDSFKQFAVNSVYRKQILKHLSKEEEELYDFLQEKNLRFEQERIANHYVLDKLV